jgi:hypothetical protein
MILSALVGFVIEKMKCPPSGPTGSHEAYNSTEGNTTRERKVTGRMKGNRRLLTPCPFEWNIDVFLISSPFIVMSH